MSTCLLLIIRLLVMPVRWISPQTAGMFFITRESFHLCVCPKLLLPLPYYFSFVLSGDADGKLTLWEWKTTRIFTRFKAHDKVCIGCQWLPHETSKVVTCGWDGFIKLWD